MEWEWSGIGNGVYVFIYTRNGRDVDLVIVNKCATDLKSVLNV